MKKFLVAAVTGAFFGPLVWMAYWLVVYMSDGTAAQFPEQIAFMALLFAGCMFYWVQMVIAAHAVWKS